MSTTKELIEADPNQDVSTARHHKVLKLRILKPADGMTWKELGDILLAVRYRVFRLANLAMSEAYLGFHAWRTGKSHEYKQVTVGELNRQLLDMLKAEKNFQAEVQNRISAGGALPSYVYDALRYYKIRALTSKSKWAEVTRGQSSLPTFRLNMAIPVRCDKPGSHRLERKNGEVELDLMICRQPYPRVILQTGSIGEGAKAVLDRLLENQNQSKEGYCQRSFEIKQEEPSHKWWLLISYEFPAAELKPSQERIVGVDLGFSCPLYLALSNGHARLGWRQFHALAVRIRSLQNQTIRRRREIQRGGNVIMSEERARSGHGRKRKLKPMAQLEGRIDRAYTTLNHQLSAAVVKFAQNHGAGVIQMEDLEGLKEELSGTFLGERWRYHQLQGFIQYKAKESGIQVRKVNPKYTSRRCSECGHIHLEFTREYRDGNRKEGKPARFQCPNCQHEADADYNAARNLATFDIENLIKIQSQKQELKTADL